MAIFIKPLKNRLVHFNFPYISKSRSTIAIKVVISLARIGVVKKKQHTEEFVIAWKCKHKYSCSWNVIKSDLENYLIQHMYNLKKEAAVIPVKQNKCWLFVSLHGAEMLVYKLQYCCGLLSVLWSLHKILFAFFSVFLAKISDLI